VMVRTPDGVTPKGHRPTFEADPFEVVHGKMNRSEAGRVVALAQERHVVERRVPGKQGQETQIRVPEQIGRVDIHLVLGVLQRRRRLTIHGWSPAQRSLNHSPSRCAGVLLFRRRS
jgi:hypothetical protein